MQASRNIWLWENSKLYNPENKKKIEELYASDEDFLSQSTLSSMKLYFARTYQLCQKNIILMEPLLQ